MNKKLSTFKASIIEAYEKDMRISKNSIASVSAFESWLMKRFYDSETERAKLWKKLWKE